MKKIAVLLIFALTLVSCMPDDTQNTPGDGTTSVLTLKFTHNWEGVELSPANFGSLEYTNENGDLMSITKLKYLVSNIRFHVIGGGTVVAPGYLLIDAQDPTSTIITNTVVIPNGVYQKLTFTFGFNQDDNAENYPDLNSANWNWPEELGGGYHFMQLEGQYNTNEGPAPYALHYGTARVSEGVFEVNHFNAEIDENVTIGPATTIEIAMDVSEWFKDPNTWDLNEFNVDLMGNYEAQKMIQENGYSVFDFGGL